MMRNWKSILLNASNPVYLPVMIRKICSRIFEFRRRNEAIESLTWCASVVESYDEFAKSINASLWEESKNFSNMFASEAKNKLSKLNVSLGGGGNYPLVYFLVRILEPEIILETGVAAGYTSKSILEAIIMNGHGKLYSSDFPYFRVDKPEEYIGILVDEHLRQNWNLYINGDDKNIKDILKSVKKIDLVHYDSDKSYAGRERFMSSIKKNITKQTIIIMDDIQDNLFFYNYIKTNSLNFRVFEFDNKYLGLIGI